MDTNSSNGSIQEKRRLLRTMVSVSHRASDSREATAVPKGHDWRGDWHEILLENTKQNREEAARTASSRAS